MRVDVHWSLIEEADCRWDATRVLYAYLDPDMVEILYIGKADGARSSVRTRMTATDKRAFWSALVSQRGIDAAHVQIGEIGLEPGARLTRQLLADVESLLIAAVHPWGNIQSRSSRIARPGLVVRCLGRSWVGPRKFEDRG